jgi:hypothetical protein
VRKSASCWEVHCINPVLLLKFLCCGLVLAYRILSILYQFVFPFLSSVVLTVLYIDTEDFSSTSTYILSPINIVVVLQMDWVPIYTSRSYLPQKIICSILLWALLCYSCPGLRLAQPGGPTGRVSVLFLFFFTRRWKQNPASEMWFYLWFRQWTKSKKTILQNIMHHCQKPSDFVYDISVNMLDGALSQVA